jgi:hypothetical protein
MGAHGVSPFQDDDGADFVAEIIDAKDMSVIADELAVCWKTSAHKRQWEARVRDLLKRLGG